MDIFGRKISGLGGVFNTSEALFTISAPGFSGVKSLVQNVQIQYSQEFKDLFELGSNNIYMTKGRPRGRMTVGSIVGGGISKAFTGDPCNSATINVRALAGGECGLGSGQVNYTLHNCFVVDFGLSVAVEDMMIRQNMVFTFSNLSES